MRTVISIMQKVLVNHFYKLNAGLLMFLFYVFFGLPQDIKTFHVSIATMIVTNQTALLLTILVWLIYNIKCIDYTIKQIKEPQQLFLSCLEHMRSFKCFLCLLYTQVPVVFTGYSLCNLCNNHRYKKPGLYNSSNNFTFYYCCYISYAIIV